MSLTKLPSIRTPLGAKGAWIVPVSKVLRMGCLLTACANPSCPCSELVVSAYSLDERVHAFGIEKGKLQFSSVTLDDQPAQLGNPMVLRLNVYTGELSGSDGKPVDMGDRRVAAIADALDAETLDALEAMWRRQKGIPSGERRRKAKVEPWEHGELVYWDAVFEVDRMETFVDSGGRVVALDMYCVNPVCDCREVSIAFHPEVLRGKEDAPSLIGRVVASFRGELRFVPEAHSDARLRALWARYRRRHPGLRVLFERYEEIRAFAAKYEAPSATVLRPNATAAEGVSVSPAPSSVSMAAPLLTSGWRDERTARRWVSTSRKRNKAAR